MYYVTLFISPSQYPNKYRLSIARRKYSVSYTYNTGTYRRSPRSHDTPASSFTTHIYTHYSVIQEVECTGGYGSRVHGPAVCGAPTLARIRFRPLAPFAYTFGWLFVERVLRARVAIRAHAQKETAGVIVTRWRWGGGVGE